MIFIGLDVSKNSTALCIENNNIVKLYSYTSSKANNIWVKKTKEYINYNHITYNYSDEKRELIKLVSIRNVKTSPEFKVFSIENKETEYLPLFHTKFQLDYPKMKSIFDQVIKYITGTVQQIQVNIKQKTKKIKTPNANPLLKKTKMSSIRKVKSNVKSKVKSKKKIEDISIPIHNEVLPVIQIKMPKKILDE
jgi:hypothetical protein